MSDKQDSLLQFSESAKKKNKKKTKGVLNLHAGNDLDYYALQGLKCKSNCKKKKI
jgi:hypothetical protein